ncbi:MAG: replicative DNA helicase [Bacteroidia bacterium]
MMNIGKVPPQAPDLEEAVLGGLMLEKDAITEVLDILKPESFYRQEHISIYKAMLQLFEKSQPVDILTVTNELRQMGELEKVGGAFYISQLTNRVTSAANIEYHSRVIAEKFLLRELIRISGNIQQEAFDESTDVFDLLDDVERELYGVSSGNIRNQYESLSTLIAKAIAGIEDRKGKTDGLTGVPSGFRDLDRITSGWQPSDLLILAARPGMGKTAMVLSLARNAAVDFQLPVVVFSLEMSALQLVNRLISAEAEIDAMKLRSGNLEDYEWAQLHSKVGKLSDAKIFIDDTPALNIFELRAKCRRLKAQHGIEMIIIDYLQLMMGKGDNRNGNREQEISSISRALKGLAKELNVPVIALSQLSREVEKRGGSKKPILSDLRESGSIEQDADMVMFLYRPEYYGLTEDEEGRPTQGTAELIIAKNRHGALESPRVRFIAKFAKFVEFDEPDFDGGGMGMGTIIKESRMNDDEEDAPF